MFEFERIFVCRDFRVEKSGISANGIGFRHPHDVARLLVFGHVLALAVSRPFRYSLKIGFFLPDGTESLGPWSYTLVPTVRADRRILLGWIPVRGVLATGTYEVIIDIEGQFITRTGFEIT